MNHTIKSIFAAVALLVAISAPAAAGPVEDFEDGLAAAQRGDYATALRLFRPLAKRGHASAQFILGVAYASGEGVKQDYAEAEKWYRKAAKQGFAAAQYNLGVMYRDGQGVKQNYAQAVKCTARPPARALPKPSTTSVSFTTTAARA